MNFCPDCGSSIVHSERDGKKRHTCSSDDCHFIDWNNPTPVVAAIIEYKGQVMLVHNVSWPPKMLALVSGFLEADDGSGH